MASSPKAALPQTITCDIVVNGGTFSAPAAALQAARTNPAAQVLLLEPTDWLGGQATAEGVAAIDNAWHNPGATLMRNNPELYYPADYRDFLARVKNPPPQAPGDGWAGDGANWVSREAFDPRTAAWILDQMIAEQPNITLMKMTVVKDVATTSVLDEFGSAVKITGLTIIRRIPIPPYKPFDKFLSQEILDWYTPANSADFTKQTFAVAPRDSGKGLVVIDASELADVVALSGAAYVVGRELTTEKMNENGTPPSMDEDGTQSFVYPFCMTGTTTPTAENELKTPFPGFDTYYAQQVASFFSLGAHSWLRVWTYRRLKNVGAPYTYDTANLDDVTMQNWYPGNDYPYGTMYKNSAGAAAEKADWKGGLNLGDLANAEKHAIAFYFYMKSYATRALETRYLNGDDPLNFMGTRTGLAKFPYIRETRRIIGVDNFRMTERYFVDTLSPSYTSGSSFRYFDSVGIGNYAVDVHPTQISTGVNITIHNPAPFYIPYRVLGSTNVRNLIVGGKLTATTFITNAAYRLHPIEWAIGSAAGGAAAHMALNGKTNYDLLDIPALRALQTAINQNSPISWAAYDASPLPPQNGDLVVNDFKTVNENTPFDVEIYHHRATRARVFLGGTQLGETTYRANARLLYPCAGAAAGTYTLRAECYDTLGTLLDTLQMPLTIVGTPVDDPFIIDDLDPDFSMIGTWTQATAQPNKYGTTYRYAQGGTGDKKATWKLYTPDPGLYEVAIWYPEASNRATDSPFTVNHKNGSITLKINQQINGGRFLVLGEFEFSGPNTGTVVLTNAVSDGTKLVLADAVRTRLIAASNVNGWMSY